MKFYIVYFNSIEFPGRYVVRPWVTNNEQITPETLLCVVNTLEEARADVPNNLCRTERFKLDDVSILEYWV